MRFLFFFVRQLFIDPGKLLPLHRFLPKPPAPKGPKKKGPPGVCYFELHLIFHCINALFWLFFLQGVGGGRGGFGGGRGGGGRGGFGGRGNYLLLVYDWKWIFD